MTLEPITRSSTKCVAVKPEALSLDKLTVEDVRCFNVKYEGVPI